MNYFSNITNILKLIPVAFEVIILLIKVYTKLKKLSIMTNLKVAQSHIYQAKFVQMTSSQRQISIQLSIENLLTFLKKASFFKVLFNLGKIKTLLQDVLDALRQEWNQIR